LPLGTVCVLDYKPRPDGITEEQGETLRALARAAMAQIELRRSSRALAEGEAKFRAITDSVDQMIWSTGPNGYHDFYNQRWYEYTGVPEGLDGRRRVERDVPPRRSGTSLGYMAALPRDR
jgi:PAS domain-containing protein